MDHQTRSTTRLDIQSSWHCRMRGIHKHAHWLIKRILTDSPVYIIMSANLRMTFMAEWFLNIGMFNHIPTRTYVREVWHNDL